MLNILKRYLSKNYLPRWIIIFFDINVIFLSLFIAHLILHRLHFSGVEFISVLEQALITIPVYLLCIIYFRPFAEVIRHTTLEGTVRLFIAYTTAFIGLVIMRMFIPYESALFINLPTLMLQYLISLLASFTFRVLVKVIYHDFFQSKKIENRIVIFGAGILGQMTLKAITNDKEMGGKVVAFIDDNKSLQKKNLLGLPVYSAENAFEKVIVQENVNELVIAISEVSLRKVNKRKVVDLCIEMGIQIKEVPKVNEWINGGINVSQFRKINIEDLLGRDSIELDSARIYDGVKDATILVTGAAGSIGSEIVRQLISFKAKEVILLDNAESPLYDLQNEIVAANNNPVFSAIIGDITNTIKLRKVFNDYKPSIVFNAAAYKHVPFMEEFPCEAARVNIGGTKNLADLSIEFGVKKFVYISTDKAVNPTNVMGATKRISEIYIQSLAQKEGIRTQFITTRFGNVLGSNGSVVPLFKKQIEAGGPITLTHKEITRYFMTIPEACQLVLEAGFMGKGGEIFVFDMGEPIKVYDLAKKMIALSGLQPDKDIEIKVTGLRPGEKLYEELLNDKEKVLPTHNAKIMIGKVRKHDYVNVNNAVVDIIESVDDFTRHDLVARMKLIVPEFISNNSDHCCLDKKPVDRKNGKKAINPKKITTPKIG